MSQLDDLRQLYFSVTKATIDRDFDRAIDLLKSMPEEERDRAAVFMQGIAEMRKEWRGGSVAVASFQFKVERKGEASKTWSLLNWPLNFAPPTGNSKLPFLRLIVAGR